MTRWFFATAEHVAGGAGLQVAAQAALVAVELVGGHPGGGDPGVQGVGEHLPGVGDLGREPHVVGHPGGPAPSPVVGPRLRQVHAAVDQRPPRRGGVGQVRGHLGVFDPPGRAGVLPLHPDRCMPDLRSPVSSTMRTPPRWPSSYTT